MDFPTSYTSTTTTYLISQLRLHLGDMNPASYRYTDVWLESALISAIKSLMSWWDARYLVDTLNNILRNPYLTTWELSEPPVIQLEDERPIILMASILVKSGSMENNAWNVGSWRDAEISYSNIEGNRSKQYLLDRDWEELNNLIKPPTKKLAGTQRQTLKGYLYNPTENRDDMEKNR
jgi:hypothetical protein